MTVLAFVLLVVAAAQLVAMAAMVWALSDIRSTLWRIELSVTKMLDVLDIMEIRAEARRSSGVVGDPRPPADLHDGPIDWRPPPSVRAAVGEM